MTIVPAPDLEEAARTAAIAQAHRAAGQLAHSLAEKPDAKPIETDVKSLRGLSGVIDQLLGEVRRCGGIDCMGRSLDGTRLWVTKDRFDAESARADRLHAALEAIVAATAVEDQRFAMLTDWQGMVAVIGEVATKAIGAPPRTPNHYC